MKRTEEFIDILKDFDKKNLDVDKVCAICELLEKYLAEQKNKYQKICNDIAVIRSNIGDEENLSNNINELNSLNDKKNAVVSNIARLRTNYKEFLSKIKSEVLYIKDNAENEFYSEQSVETVKKYAKALQLYVTTYLSPYSADEKNTVNTIDYKNVKNLLENNNELINYNELRSYFDYISNYLEQTRPTIEQYLKGIKSVDSFDENQDATGLYAYIDNLTGTVDLLATNIAKKQNIFNYFLNNVDKLLKKYRKEINVNLEKAYINVAEKMNDYKEARKKGNVKEVYTYRDSYNKAQESVNGWIFHKINTDKFLNDIAVSPYFGGEEEQFQTELTK